MLTFQRKSAFTSLNLSLQALLNLCLLTNAITQVVELGSADLTSADSGNGDDGGRVNRENLFTAYTIGDAANGNGFVDAAVLLGNDGAFESLSTLAVAFLNQNLNADSVTDIHFGQFGLHVLFAENFDQIHNLILPYI